MNIITQKKKNVTMNIITCLIEDSFIFLVLNNTKADAVKFVSHNMTLYIDYIKCSTS